MVHAIMPFMGRTNVARKLCLAFFVMAVAAFVCRATDPYGDISDVKVAKPADKEDVKTVPPPKDAIVLFDGKNLDKWTARDSKEPQWRLLDGGVMQSDKL